MVSVWYPALPGSAAGPNVFLDPKFAFDPAPAWGGVFVPQAPYFHTYASRGAAPARGPKSYPVLLYSHGGLGDRNQHADLAEELASYGYIVVFPDHAHAWRSVFPDGRVTSSANMPLETVISIVMLNEDIADMRFLLEELEHWNADDGWLAGMVDINNVAMAGMSMGAWLPMELCRSDSRCRAALLVELGLGMGAVVQRLAQQEVRSPLLMLNASNNGSTLYFDRASKDATWVQIGNTEHDMFSSYYWWVRPGDVPGGLETARTIRGYTLWFLNKYLKGSTDPMPARASYPRVINFRQK
jgi:dienelactone hydrolase